jgi:cbb3-type cytochrome oxidase subunit 3
MITNPILPSPAAGGAENAGLALLQKFIPYAIIWGLILGVVIFFFMFLIGGIKWISSGGDKQKLEEARGTITNALIGLIILLALFAIIGLVGTFFHVNLLNLTIPTLSGGSSGGNTCTGFTCQGPTHCQLDGGLPHCVNNN